VDQLRERDTERDRERERERETDRQTDRKKERKRQTDRQAERQRERERQIGSSAHNLSVGQCRVTTGLLEARNVRILHVGFSNVYQSRGRSPSIL